LIAWISKTVKITRLKRYYSLLLVALPLHATAADQLSLKNTLSQHPSPYLRMHGEDPVHWQTWGPQALKLAKKHQRPIFVSSGYFSCHWCHVMQAENYIQPHIAKLINDTVIPVKVDRELQPDLDKYLVDFVQQQTGHAGWPLHVFLTPDGLPLTGFTYLPTKRFEAALLQINSAWNSRREQLLALAQQAAEADNKTTALNKTATAPNEKQRQRLRKLFIHSSLYFSDEISGGFGQGAKFPSTPRLRTLLSLSQHPSDEQERLISFLRLTLNQMQQRSLRDVIDGGFFRYTTDPTWFTPHFEKMLYTTALLVPIYLQAADRLKDPRYAATAHQGLNFLLSTMRADDGSFISSLSAANDLGEGGYYLWSDDTLKKWFSPTQQKLLTQLWGMSNEPGWPAGHLPIPENNPEDMARQHKVPLADILQQKQQLIDRFKLARKERHIPQDDKRIAAWNGLVLIALARAGQTPQGQTYRTPAKQLANVLWHKFRQGNDLLRALSDKDQPLGTPTLADYSYVVAGLTAWAKLSQTDDDWQRAYTLAKHTWQRFHTPQGWRHTENPTLPQLSPRLLISDSTLPSPSALLLENGLLLAQHFNDHDWEKALQSRLYQSFDSLLQSPFDYSSTIRLLTEISP
jgi:uncharacterized protein